ncbi:MAG: hypothetical protein WCJ58_07365 [bacterium]
MSKDLITFIGEAYPNLEHQPADYLYRLDGPFHLVELAKYCSFNGSDIFTLWLDQLASVQERRPIINQKPFVKGIVGEESLHQELVKLAGRAQELRNKGNFFSLTQILIVI